MIFNFPIDLLLLTPQIDYLIDISNMSWGLNYARAGATSKELLGQAKR